MSEKIKITINKQEVKCDPGITILKAAEIIGITIPTICLHDACSANALCRICVVEIKGARTLVPSCVAKVTEGMEIETHNKRVNQSRKTILEMMLSTSDLSQAPEIQKLMDEYEVNPDRFPDAHTRQPDIIDDNPMFVRDYEKCILCWRCVQVCAEDAQYAFAINFKGRGYETEIATFFKQPLMETTCVFCGQCIGVCPTNALKPKREWLLELGNSPDDIMSLTRTERKRKNSSVSAKTSY